jgi:hypothetical protein
MAVQHNFKEEPKPAAHILNLMWAGVNDAEPL